VKLYLSAVFFGLVFVASACGGDTRFPICKTDAECVAREENDGKLLCANLRCVQCRYDTDCPAGSYCDKTQICQSIAPKQVEDPSVSTAEYKTLDECMQSCKDSSCTDVCNARFPDTKKPRKRR
jgi:Cys-rich repeat protein